MDSGINSILDNSANMSSQFALKFFKNFMKKMAIGTIGGLIAVGDQWAAGVTDPDELALAFRNGFFTGFALSFASGKVAMAPSGLCVIGGFAGAVKSFKNGNFWQGVYRISVSTLGAVGWYKQYGSKISDLFKCKVEPIKISDKKMYQLGKHYNKHGREMGFNSKSEYDSAAREFANTNQTNPNASIIQGNLNMRDSTVGPLQRAVSIDGMTVVIDVSTGDIIDFYYGTDNSALINIEILQ